MRVFLTIGLLGLGASLLSIFLVERFLSERIAILGSFIGLQKSTNTGIAFGVDLPFQLPLILGALLAVAIAGCTVAKTKLSQAAFGLIVGGGLSNVVDRLIDGRVTDVFQVGTFPIFNVADSCITIGVGLLLLEMILNRNFRKDH